MSASQVHICRCYAVCCGAAARGQAGVEGGGHSHAHTACCCVFRRFQTARHFDAVAGGDGRGLEALAEAAAVLQHHDAGELM